MNDKKCHEAKPARSCCEDDVQAKDSKRENEREMRKDPSFMISVTKTNE